MAFDSIEDIKDSDFRNGIQDISEVVHSTAAASTKTIRSISNNDISNLEAAKRNLNDLNHLMTSLHAMLEPREPKRELDDHAIAALHCLQAAIQDFKNATPEEADLKDAKMDAAVKRAVTAMNLKRSFTEETAGTAKDNKGNVTILELAQS